MKPSDVAVLVLAAGAGSRFSAGLPGTDQPSRDGVASSKLLAPLDGRPVLEHVLDRAAELRSAATVVVLGSGPAADSIEASIAWRQERRVINAHPERGLASSLRVGLVEMARPELASAGAALIMLGDQPRVRLGVMRALLAAAAATPMSLIVAPRYAEGGGSNPLLVRRAAWPLAAEMEGDRGFGPLLRARPDLVLFVDVSGTNPDVDTPADLAHLSRA